MNWSALLRRRLAVVAVSLHNGVTLVRLEPGVNGGKPLLRVARRRVELSALRRWSRKGFLSNALLVLVLPAEMRTITHVAKPETPDAEVVSALRWQIANSLDYPAEEALIDAIDLPILATGQAPQMMAISARASLVKKYMEPLLDLGLTPDVIDIQDQGIRNLSLLAAPASAARACVWLRGTNALITIIAGAELCQTRAMEMGDTAQNAEGVADRLSLQLQRTLDAFDRQATHYAVRYMHLLPNHHGPALADALNAHLTIKCLSLDFAQLFDMSRLLPDRLQSDPEDLVDCLGTAAGRLAAFDELVQTSLQSEVSA